MTLKHNVASNYIIKIEIQKLVKGLLKENEQENRFDFNAAEAKNQFIQSAKPAKSFDFGLCYTQIYN